MPLHALVSGMRRQTHIVQRFASTQDDHEYSSFLVHLLSFSFSSSSSHFFFSSQQLHPVTHLFFNIFFIFLFIFALLFCFSPITLTGFARYLCLSLARFPYTTTLHLLIPCSWCFSLVVNGVLKPRSFQGEIRACFRHNLFLFPRLLALLGLCISHLARHAAQTLYTFGYESEAFIQSRLLSEWCRPKEEWDESPEAFAAWFASTNLLFFFFFFFFFFFVFVYFFFFFFVLFVYFFLSSLALILLRFDHFALRLCYKWLTAWETNEKLLREAFFVQNFFFFFSSIWRFERTLSRLAYQITCAKEVWNFKLRNFRVADVSNLKINWWGSKFKIMKCRTTNIWKFQNWDY